MAPAHPTHSRLQRPASQVARVTSPHSTGGSSHRARGMGSGRTGPHRRGHSAERVPQALGPEAGRTLWRLLIPRAVRHAASWPRPAVPPVLPPPLRLPPEARALASRVAPGRPAVHRATPTMALCAHPTVTEKLWAAAWTSAPSVPGRSRSRNRSSRLTAIGPRDRISAWTRGALSPHPGPRAHTSVPPTTGGSRGTSGCPGTYLTNLSTCDMEAS